MKKLTLDEIAKKAGVSRTTASRVLNNRPNVREEVRQRVLAIIEETGYQPNPAARSLAAQRSQIIGLVLPRRTDVLFSDPYFSFLLHGVAEGCNLHDYTLTLFLLQTEADEEKLYPKLSQQGLLDGLVFQVGSIGDSLITQLIDAHIPLVIAGRPAQSDNVSYVDVDNTAGAYQAVMHLLQLGYTRVGTITGSLNTTVGLDRKLGYEKALKTRGFEIDESLIVAADFTEMGGYYAMRRMLNNLPQAIFIASDIMAAGALRAIQEANLKVPHDIALVGFDDLPPAILSTPQLTTIRQPIRRFGRKAVEMLIDIIENGETVPQHVIFNTELVIRDSCGAV